MTQKKHIYKLETRDWSKGVGEDPQKDTYDQGMRLTQEYKKERIYLKVKIESLQKL